MAKSEFRVKVETAIEKAINIDLDGVHAFNDKSKSGRRLKFAFVKANKDELNKIRVKMREMFPNNDIIVENAGASGYRGFWGLTVKVLGHK